MLKIQKIIVLIRRVLLWVNVVKRGWEDNIKMDLQEVGWGDMDWIDMAQDSDRWRAVVSAVMNLRVP
jgi:uncharacterized protein YebE (UPF0316 family)